MRYLLPAILLLGTQIASAQSILKDKDDKELSVLLNEVVITGTGTEHYLKDAPVQTEVNQQSFGTISGTQYRRFAQWS